MNRVYSILVKGLNKDSEYYQRRVDPEVGHSKEPSIRDLLVVNTQESSYYNYQAEQLIQICRKSLLKDALSDFDPLNTYDNTFATIEPVTEIGGLPSGVSMDILEPDMRHNWISKVIAISIDADAGTGVVNGAPVTFKVTGNMTDKITVAPGLAVKFRGNLPSYRFSTSLAVTRQPTRDIKELVEALKASQFKWKAKYADYRMTRDINDWLAAFILNYCEGTDG